MRVHAPAVALVFATLGLVAANATSACTFTSTGAGGDAATPSYWEGGNNGSSSGSFGTNSGSGNVGSPSGSGGGTNSSSGSVGSPSGSGGGTSSGSGGGAISCGPNETPCGNSCCPNIAPVDSGAPAPQCSPASDPNFLTNCQGYYADETSSSLPCSSCIAGSQSQCSKAGGGTCALSTCEDSCNTSVPCGTSCPAQYCTCVAQCLATQGTCCAQVDAIYSCFTTGCQGSCGGN